MTTKRRDVEKILEKMTGGPLTMARLLYSVRMAGEMSQVAFAKLLSIPRSNLCDIEKGRRYVGPELAMRFAKKLGKSIKLYIQVALQDQLERAGLHYHVNIEAA